MAGASTSIRKLSSKLLLCTTLGLALIGTTLLPKLASAQSIVPTPNGTGTEAILNNGQWTIQGGSLSADQLNLFHQFQQFGLTEGQIANFLANPHLRNIISTVDGGNPSIINGLLQMTGGNPNLFLMNPSGIIFGPNAQLNVPASFSAITADGIQFGDRWLNAIGPNDYSSLIGNPTAFRFSSDFAGAIVNAGNLQVNPGAALALMGGTVINTGQLSASQGQILITAAPGESLVRLTLPGYILNLEVEVPLTQGNTPQTWQLPITALPTLLTQGLTPELLGLAINASGGVQLADGTPIPNAPGTAMVSGGVHVSGNQGGTVAVLGDRVGLVGAQIDASGIQGSGGQIRIGGDYQGAGNLPTAQRTYVDANTNIAADALTTGNGGRIIIWADEATGFDGNITARGGQLSGDGGFAEISGRDYLQFDGTADLSSVNGEPGTLLLDPATITISNAVSTTPGVSSSLPNILLNDFPGQDITINQTVLENAASTSRIILEADQRITIGTLNQRPENLNDPNDLSAIPTLILGNGATFMVERGVFEMIVPNSRILTNGGDLNITAQSINTGRILTSNPVGNAGAINLTATQGDIITDVRAQVANFDTTVIGRGGDISLSAPNGGITVNNNLVSISANGDAGNISLVARNDLVIRCAVGANYCIESFGGGIAGSPSRGNSGSISFISNQGSIRILNSPPTGANAINTTNDSFSAGSITIQAADSIDIGGRVLSGGAINNAPINLSASSINLVNSLEIVNDLGGQSQSANITINGNINGTNNGGQSLTVNAGRGSLNFNNAIGSITPIGSLTASGRQATVLGNIQTANSPISFNSPVNLTNSSPLTFNSGTAAITLNDLNAGNTSLTLIANDFNFSGALRGNNTLTIQPSTLNRGITLGTTVNDTLNLSPTEIAALQGFSNVTIGGGSGNITVNAPVTFNTPTQLSTTGNINVSGNITTTGQNLTFGSNINLGQDVTLSTGAGAGNLSFLGTITGQPYRLALEAGTGNILLPRQVNVGQFNVNSAQTLFLGEGITTANTPLTFNVPVVLTQNAALRTGTPGANITFGNTLNSEAGERNNLNLAAGGGDISINGAVGNTQPLGNVTIESARNLTTNAPIQVGSLQQTGTPAMGNIALGQPITTTNGGVNLNAAGSLTANTITTNGGGINAQASGDVAITSAASNGGGIAISGNTVQTGTLSATGGGINVQSAGNLTTGNLTSTGGNVALTTSTGNVVTGSINTASTVGNARPSVTVNAGGNIDTLAVTSGGGNVQLTSAGSGVVSTGNITSGGGNITLGNFLLWGDRLVASDGGNINFLGTINGPHALNLRAGATGNIQFTGLANIGRFNLLSAQTFLLGAGITTANTPLTFNVPVVLTQNAALRTGTPGANITFGNTVNSEAGERNNLNLAAASGDITFNGAVGNGPNQQLSTITVESVRNLTANAPIQAASFQQTGTPATGNITLNNSLTTSNGGVNLNATGAVTANTITTNGGGITLDSTTGNVQADNLSATGGAVNVTAPGTVTVPTANGTGGVALTSTGSSVQTSTVTTNGGDVALNAQTNLTVDNITTNGGNIALSSNTDTITVDTLSSSSGTAAGGNIAVLNPNAINAAAINASGATTGGNIALSAGGGSPTGAVTTGNLTATGVDGGGNITVLARDTITAEEIDTSATVGRGGNVLLDPLGDVQVTFINAQGGTNGAGGNVTIESIDRFFRATGAFPDRNGILASISAAGGGGEGTITITHNGGAANVLVPFIISTPTQNGTVGALTTGANNIIFPGSFLGPYTQGNIRIITSPQATLAADSSLPDTLPEEIQPEDADNQPFWLDEYFTRRTEDYLGINGETRVKSLEEIQDDLRRVEESTNIRPALIYVLFEPRESLLTIPETGPFNPDDLVNRGALSRFEPLPSDRLQMILVTAYGEPILYRPPENTDEIDGNDITRENAPREVFDFESAVLEDLRNYEERRVTDESLYLHHAQVLYQWLVAPLEQDLESQGIQNLVFIMDDGLRTTPLAVLSAMHNGHQFIIENYSVGLMPSFSLTSSRHINLRSSRILAMGMSDFSQYEELDNLEAVDEEVRLINQSLWGGSNSNIDRFLGSNFTPENLILQRRDQSYNIVHLATHAKVEIGAPENSFLVFYDGKLFFDQLDRLRLDSPPIELLVLSACQAALSPDDESAELGFAGLSVQAGVNTVLASFWEVPDFPTLGLMTEFYNQLQTSPIRSEALRQAQLAMINREVFFQNDRLFWSSNSEAIPALRGVIDTLWLSHPGYWSSFTMIGNPW